jgi:hypothetical protein
MSSVQSAKKTVDERRAASPAPLAEIEILPNFLRKPLATEVKTPANGDARQQQSFLEERFRQAKPVEKPPAPAAVPKPKRSFHLTPRQNRVMKTLAIASVTLLLGWTPVLQLLQSTSAEAFVNARIITIRSPIDGEIEEMAPSSGNGADANKGAALIRTIAGSSTNSRGPPPI